MRAIPAVLCSLLVACASSDSPSRLVTGKRLVGEWCRYGGLAWVTLTLHRDASYDAMWTGCLGVYGTARGHWRLDQSTITLTPTEEKDLMRNYLRTLDVVPNEEGLGLVPSDERKQMDTQGADSSYWCFTRSN